MATRSRRRHGFTPFKTPTRPPAGMYDPALDSGERAATRGYGDLQQDTERNIGRMQDDLGIGVGNVERNRGRALADAARERDQSLADLMRSRARENEDYGTSTATLNRNFGNLAANQLGAANAAGLVGVSGYDSTAAANREGNQRREQVGLDTTHHRFEADSLTNEQRVKGAYELAAGADGAGGRINENAADQIGQANLTEGRGVEDARTGQERAGRELGFYSQDVGAQRWFQAGQAGYVPPSKPANEGTRYGVSYQRQPGGGALLPSGRQVSRRGLRSILQTAARRRGVAYR